MSFTKNLIIGLGGTGQQILLEAKSSIINHFGEVPDDIKFLAIDTDVPDDKVVNPYTQAEIQFEGSEFLRLSGNGAINVAKEAEGEWWPEGCTDWPLPGAGAAAKRMHGRAKLGLNINNVDRVLKEAITAVRTVGEQGPNVYQEGKIRVFVACSLAGGTGSGCWLDVANLLREELSESDRLVSVMLLGDAFEGRPGTTNKYANTVASLKELQWVLSDAVPESSPYKNYKLYHRDMRFPDAKLFDSCFLVSKSGPYGVTDEPDAINRALGRWIYHMCGPAGEEFDRREDNVQEGYPYILPGRGQDQEPRKGVFWSLGISELVYEGSSERARAAEDAASRLIDEIIAGASTIGEIESIDIPDFLRRNNLQEEQEDQVIDFLFAPRDRDRQCVRIASPDREELERDSHTTLYTQWKNFCDRWPDTARSKASQNKLGLESESRNSLIKKRDALLSKPGGVSRAELFFGNLAREFKNLENMMEQESLQDKDKSNMRLRQAKAKFDEQISLSFFSWRKEVGAKVEALEPMFRDALKLSFESERKKIAVELYHSLSQFANDIYDSIMSLKRNLNDTKERILTLSRQRSRGLRSIFRTDLPAEENSSGSGDSLVDRVVARVRPDLTDSWLAPDLEIESLQNRLVEVVRGEIGDQFEESVYTRVSNKEPEAIGDILGDLFNKSAPMWSFDRGITAQNPEFQPPHSAIVTAGPSEMPNNFEGLLERVTSSAEPAWCNLDDSNSLTFIQWQHGVPAFAINCIKNMISSYKNERLWQQVGVGFHLHADWKEELPGLEPDNSSKTRLETWALGLAHGLIVEERNSFVVTNTIELGAPTDENTWRHRLAERTFQDAMVNFARNRDLSNNIAEMLEIKKENDGNSDFANTVKEFRDNFAARISESGQVTERQKALRQVLEWLNEWVEANCS